MKKNNLLQKLLEETGANNVRDICYDDFDNSPSRWVVAFKGDLKEMYFDSFDDVYTFITTEGNQS